VGVRERPDQALVDTLAEQLHARHLLVVLDNCEHLVAACAELVGELSSACPQLHVLATSRVPLVVEGEATFEVAPLPVPDPDAVSASTVAAADAARLFEVRARQVTADFRIGDDNASAVAEICRRLDGIPSPCSLSAAHCSTSTNTPALTRTTRHRVPHRTGPHRLRLPRQRQPLHLGTTTR
jgi:predicted ATPase